MAMAWPEEETDLSEAALQSGDDLFQQTRVFPQLRLLLGAQRQQIAQQKDLVQWCMHVCMYGCVGVCLYV